MKRMILPNYKYVFDDKTGFFMRWGKTLDDDPEFAPIGPEILDCEISEVCSQGCRMCYKSNTVRGKNMSLETFKNVLDKMPSVLQVAFGIGDIDANPDFFRMMTYCRTKGVVPNVTINGFRLSDELISRLVELCGAIAVSNYGKDSCYGTVEKLTNAGLKQVNIHQLVSAETKDQIFELIEDRLTDPRLQKLNAIVFLSLKQRGRGTGYHRISDDDFKKIINLCFEKDIPFGFDSCSAPKFTEAIRDHPNFEKIVKLIEPCESTLFSSYVNVDGNFFPCSFAENGEGLNVAECNDFLEDIWYNPKTIEWRQKLLDGCRNCPMYEI